MTVIFQEKKDHEKNYWLIKFSSYLAFLKEKKTSQLGNICNVIV